MVEEGMKDVRDMGQHVGQQVGQRAEDAAVATGRGMQNVAEAIRDYAPQGGVVGSAAHAVSDRLASGGRYLEHEKLSGMADDLTDMIRKNPVPALLIAVGVGFLFATAISRR